MIKSEEKDEKYYDNLISELTECISKYKHQIKQTNCNLPLSTSKLTSLQPEAKQPKIENSPYEGNDIENTRLGGVELELLQQIPLISKTLGEERNQKKKTISTHANFENPNTAPPLNTYNNGSSTTNYIHDTDSKNYISCEKSKFFYKTPQFIVAKSSDNSEENKLLVLYIYI